VTAQVILDLLTIAGLFLTTIGLSIAIKQIIDDRKALRQTSELLLRETKLLYEATRTFTSSIVPSAGDRDRIIKLWHELLNCAKRMYRDDEGWKLLLEDLKKGGKEGD